jgi:hypothetical protein
MQMQINPAKLDRFIYFVNERELMRRRRESGQEWPWSEDPILQHYHFCNIRREDDRGTKELRALRVQMDLAMHKRPEYYTAARLFNTAPSVSDYYEHGPEYLKERMASGGKVFHVAYVVSTCGERMDKVDYVDRLIKQVRAAYISNQSCRECFDCLRKINGLGSFLAGQIVADLRFDQYLHYAPDWGTFAVMGPGSKKGMDILMGAGTTERNFHDRLKFLNMNVMGVIPSLDMQDLQNCLCEFQKFMRYVTNGPGRRRIYV